MILAPELAIGIVTFNRCELLDGLLASVAAMSPAPTRVIVVDNASSDATQDVIARWAARLPDGMLVNARQDVNRGGAGGFSEAARLALELGVAWVWLMDDDVEVVPDALARLEPWLARFEVVHGRRYDVDGTPFYWQPNFNQFLGVPLPYSPNVFNKAGYAVINSGTFEGMLVATEIVRRIGLPDPRFFVAWDDAIYAWLAAQVTQVAYVDTFVLQKKRPQQQVSLGLRHFNDSSRLFKYHVLRNRAYVGRYFETYGKLNRFGFALGTAWTFAKEVIRLVVVERSPKGFGELVRGWRDGRKIWADPDWRPMPALGEGSPHG